MSETVSGFLIVLLAGVIQGSFMVPMAYVKHWAWENSWAVFSVLGMVVFNWMLATASIPSLLEIYAQSTSIDLLTPALFGLCWGVGAICFGLGVAAAGFALGYSIIMGITLSVGAFVPMLILNREAIFTPNGLLVVASLMVMIVGLIVFGKAGGRKESEQSEKSGAITKMSTLSFKAGLVICVLSGVFSSLINVGFALSQSLVESATASGAGSAWAGNAVWAILFSFGALANLGYCGYLFVRNDSFKAFRAPGFAKNFILVAAMSLMWIGSFVLYGLGAGKMGQWGLVVGWGTFLALSVMVANLWGSAQGEWANTSTKTRRLMATGLGLLATAIVITSVSNLS